MDCRVPKSIEFRCRLGFKQHDIILTKEQSRLIRIIKIFSNEELLQLLQQLKWMKKVLWMKKRERRKREKN